MKTKVRDSWLAANAAQPGASGGLGRLAFAATLSLATACSSNTPFQTAEAGTPQTTTTCEVDASIVHGVRPDGRVDVSAAEAWPNHSTNPTTSQNAWLSACAIISACFRLTPVDGGPTLDQQMADGTRSCLDPANHPNEEQEIPDGRTNERWAFTVQTLLAAGGCGALFASTTRPAGIICQEAGCWSDPSLAPAPVTCAGDIATLAASGGPVSRDCSHSFTRCSTDSPTGCTDRAPVTCQPAGTDRCDGDIKLGCDHCGLVSFHDCSAMGGHCVESTGGAACVYPNAGLCTPADQTCNGSSLTACVEGTPVTVDCVALGLAGCTAGHCVAP